ncbi:MAG: RNA polymerase sigma factor RpoE [Gammaproteobacteria bacterium]|nr:RNA polymerase sigma factor RpoE [Gammaproteobacteria bacterium]
MEQQDVDQVLVLQVQKGDKRAFDLLVLKYQHKIVALVNRFVKDPVAAQDVAQEAFIRAYRALVNFRGESAFYTWLYRIAVNTAKNYLVAKSRRPPATDLDADEAELLFQEQGLTEQATPENMLIRDQSHQQLMAALDGLSPPLREAITLREMDGMSYEAIAEMMETPIGTVRSRIHRAREMIVRQLQQQEDQYAKAAP